MRIDYHPYILESASSSRAGTLLRVDDQNGKVGYADCHPWHELGDKPLQLQLEQLRQGKATQLIRCSLNFASMDAEARYRGVSLSDSLQYPDSHLLIMDLLSSTPEDINSYISEGFTCLKIKMGNVLAQEVAQLLKLFSTRSIDLKLRLDFNEKLSPDTFRSLLKALEPIRDLIDYVEDPFPFHPMLWSSFQTRYQISLACDRQVFSARYHPEAANRFIFKPAVNSWELLNELPQDRVIVTTYLDHPLGQLAAAYAAAKIDPMKRHQHGLLSHRMYRPNVFSRLLSQLGPQFSAPRGTGFGFDDELAALDWKLLR